MSESILTFSMFPSCVLTAFLLSLLSLSLSLPTFTMSEYRYCGLPPQYLRAPSPSKHSADLRLFHQSFLLSQKRKANEGLLARLERRQAGIEAVAAAAGDNSASEAAPVSVRVAEAVASAAAAAPATSSADLDGRLLSLARVPGWVPHRVRKVGYAALAAAAAASVRVAEAQSATLRQELDEKAKVEADLKTQLRSTIVQRDALKVTAVSAKASAQEWRDRHEQLRAKHEDARTCVVCCDHPRNIIYTVSFTTHARCLHLTIRLTRCSFLTVDVLFPLPLAQSCGHLLVCAECDSEQLQHNHTMCVQCTVEIEDRVVVKLDE
jgi:hypothetical protein